MKPNIIGIVGVVILFISLALPWWTMIMSTTILGTSYSYSASIYPYQATLNVAGTSTTAQLDIWYGWTALALIVVGGMVGIAGSLMRGSRMLLTLGGVLALLSVIVFAAGLQNELSNTVVGSGWPIVGLFSNGTVSVGTFSGLNYTTYLSFGFWLALVAAIIMLFASLRKPKMVAPTSPPPASA